MHCWQEIREKLLFVGTVEDAALVLLSHEGKENYKKIAGFGRRAEKNVQLVESRRDHGLKQICWESPPLPKFEHIVHWAQPWRGKESLQFPNNTQQLCRSRNLSCSPRQFPAGVIEEVWWVPESTWTAAMSGPKGLQRTPKDSQILVALGIGPQVTSQENNPRKCGKTLNSERWILCDSWICARISFREAKWRKGDYQEWLVTHTESMNFKNIWPIMCNFKILSRIITPAIHFAFPSG